MPLSVITLGQTKSDNINRMITITDDVYLVIFSKNDHIKRPIKLTSDFIKWFLLY